MTEAKFVTKLNKWLAKNLDHTAMVEAKVTEGKSLPFSAVSEYQNKTLPLAQHKMVYKFPDVGLHKKPSDTVVICDAIAYIAIMFECNKRAQKEFFLITYNTFKKEQETSDSKSLSYERARELTNPSYLK